MCQKCPLAKTRKNIVWGSGPKDTGLFLCGEAPGEAEDVTGRPFVGKAGAELDNYLALYTGHPRPEWYVTNVLKCRPPKNRDPKPKEIAECRAHLEEELAQVRPKLILALGGFAARFLGVDMDLEVVHGIPQWKSDRTVIPCYHPALGLHDTSKMILIQRDFEAVGGWFKGKEPRRIFPSAEYFKHTTTIHNPWEHLGSRCASMAVDTENTWDGRLWSVQVSGSSEPTPASIPPRNTFYPIGGRLWPELPTPPALGHVIFHNSPHDLRLLRTVGIRPRSFTDTMAMAYLLGDEPQGLKALAYRHLGIKMQSYDEVVGPGQRMISTRYLWKVADLTGIPPGPNPRKWSIQKRAKRILKDLPAADAWERWHNIDPEDGRREAEARLGPMPRADLSSIPYKDAVGYACRDSMATYYLEPILRRRIDELNLGPTLALDLGIIEMLVDMEQYGMPVEAGRLERLGVDLGIRMAEIEGEIHKMIGYSVNPGSAKQVREMLFKGLKLRSRKKTPGGEDSTGQKYMEMMKNEHPVVQKVLDWRKLEKLKGTYAEGLPGKVREGRIHPRILYTRTATGRLASKDPNLQNIPVRTTEGRMIRDCFQASEGMEFLSCDYSQIELRVLAHESQDPTMLGVYRNGLDLHTTTAAKIFGIPEEDVDAKEHRRPAKTINFGVVYGISANGLRESMAREGADLKHWPLDRCEEFIGEWFKLYPGVREYMVKQELHARRYEFVRDMFGRLRWVPEVKSVHPQIVAAGVRQAGNMGIQSGAQGIMKRAMADLIPIYRRWWNDGITFRPLNQVHDDLVWEVDEDWVEEAYLIVRTMMEAAVELSVPVVVDGKRGKRWGSLTPL